MRVYDECERHVIFDDGDEMPPEVMLHWGSQKARKRMQPSSLVIKWERRDSEEWQLRQVYLFGHQVHKTASNSFIHYLYQLRGPVWQEDREIEVADNIPEWVIPHVTMSHPQFEAVFIDAMMSTLKSTLGIT